MSGTSDQAAEGSDPPESDGGEELAIARVWDWVRPVLDVTSLVADAVQHRGPAWALRGLVSTVDLAIVVAVRLRHR